MADTILVISDNAAEAQALVAVLTPQGYVVHTSSSAEATPLALGEFVPDLVIVDLACADVYTRLKTATGWSAPVIFSGVSAAPVERTQVFALGGVDYLPSFFHAEEVLARVTTQLTLRHMEQKIAAQEKRLQEEILAHQHTEAALRAANSVLEQQIIESTATLRASEAMFRYLLTRANDGYVIINDQEQVLYANAKAQVYLGLSRETDKTEPPIFTDLILQRYNREPRAAWELWPKKMFIDKAPLPLYLVCPETASAPAFWLQVEILDITAGLDMGSGRIICLRDITEKTTLQEELSRFHSVIAHKLRTPMVPIYTGLTFLRGQAERMTRDDMLLFIRNAAEAAEHLYLEIEEIVRYLGAPRIAMPDAAFPLANFEALIAEINNELMLSNITVMVDESLRTQRLAISRWSLETMLWEILENARKFHPRTSPMVTVRVEEAGVQQVGIQVWDNGLTLSPEQLIRMWTPYYQVDKYTTGQIAGMGLGLSMVAVQVWSVGGTCRSFNREDGPGIVVELVLPTQV